MRLCVSSEAARGATPRELIAACARRGLAGLELHLPEPIRTGGAEHALEAATVACTARDAGVEVCGLYRPRLGAAEIDAAVTLAAAMDAPVIVPVSGVDRVVAAEAAAAFAQRGARLLLAHDSDPRVVDAIRWLIDPLPGDETIGLAWEIRPGVDDPGRLPDVLETAGGALRYVRLHGGGPEAQAQGGMGIGSLMARLTLARYSGPLVLTPSDPRYHVAWNRWLGRGGGWGCGSRAGKAEATAENVTHRPALEIR